MKNILFVPAESDTERERKTKDAADA